MIETFLLGLDFREFKSRNVYTRHVAVLQQIAALRLIAKRLLDIPAFGLIVEFESHKNGKLRAERIGSIHSTVTEVQRLTTVHNT